MIKYFSKFATVMAIVYVINEAIASLISGGGSGQLYFISVAPMPEPSAKRYVASAYQREILRPDEFSITH